MSVSGPSGLGTLLVQRLDAVLGTTLSQQTNLVAGVRPSAITQAGEAQRNEAVQNRVTRDTREGVDQAQRQTEQTTRQAVERSKIDAHRTLLNHHQPNTGATSSAPTTLGTAARTILALLQAFPEQPAVIRSRQPLIQPSGQNFSQALAQNLSQALQSSGLFYESHLSALSFGKYAASALKSEPQALLGNAARGLTGRATTTANPASSSGAPATENPANIPAGSSRPEAAQGTQPPSSSAPAQGRAEVPAGTNTQTSTSTGQAASGANPATGVTSALAALHPETHTLVRQQLEVLANQGLIWKGEAWPGTDLEMHIQRRHEDADAPPDENQTPWSTRLRLTLPLLGGVDVKLSLNGSSIQMAIVAPDAAPLLTQNTSELHDRFSEAGLKLAQLTVVRQQDNAGTDNE